MSRTLRDLGEFAVLDKLLPLGNLASGNGDDCYHFPFGEGFLAVTADPGPTPLVALLGEDWHDMSDWGWYAATASASDLATTAAKPLFMTNCIFAKPDMPVSDLEEYFTGYNTAIETFGFINAGGDLSSGTRFRSVCTAVGWVSGKEPLRRSGCSPGDVLACIGTCGHFASAFLRAVRTPRHRLSHETLRALRRPVPRIREMQVLRSVARLTATSDASDGLLGAIWNIAERSNCGFQLELTDAMLPQIVKDEARRLQIDPWSLFAFWGDWQILVTFPAIESFLLSRVAHDEGIPIVIIGRACHGPPALGAEIDGEHRSVNLIRNEHFSTTSYYLAGLEDVTAIMRRPVFGP